MTTPYPHPETSPQTAPRRVASEKAAGVLEVGCNDAHEVVVNHPDLKPDENGVGHIIFSPEQARNLASALTKHAGLAERAAFEERERERIASLPPVDHTARVLVSGKKESEQPDYREIRSDGQQKDYVVLSEEERRKGFVRPVRGSYKHVGPSGPRNPLRDLMPEEFARYQQFGYVKFEKYPEDSAHGVGKYWTQPQLNRIGKGCGQITSMGRSLAETYAREPHFYSGTFCVGCGTHYPVGEEGEFVWADDPRQRVGA